MSANGLPGAPDVARLMDGVPYLTLEELMAHPRLEDARRVFVDGFLAIYDGNHQAMRLIGDASRFFVFHNIILLDAAYRPELPETWPTIGRIKTVLQLYGMSSDR